MIFEALLVAAWAFLCGIDNFDVALGIFRPIISGPVVGAILGDLQVGVVTGATLELAWLGLQPSGGAQPPNVNMGVIAAVAFQIFSIRSGHGELSADSALGLGLPIAVLTQLLVILFFTLTSFTMNRMDKYCEEGNTNGIDRLLILTICARGLLYAVIAFLTISLGQSLVDFIVTNVPTELLKGIGIGAKMIPAIGFAILLKIMWAPKYAGWFFLGFLVTTYLKVPITGIAGIAICIGVLYYYYAGSNSGNGGNNQVEEFEDGI